MSVKPIHWYSYEKKKTLCGLALCSAAKWVVEKPQNVTCKRCLHGLKHGWGSRKSNLKESQQ